MPGKSLLLSLVCSTVALAASVTAQAQQGALELEIRRPLADTLVPSSEGRVTVEGGASTFGGVRQLDLFLVLDTSRSLKKTDPDDYRMKGAIGLVESLPEWSDIHVGVVAFDNRVEMTSPLTSDREAVINALKKLDRHGFTDLAAGIEKALAGFEQSARPGSSRVMLLFTDGKSDEDAAQAASQAAREQGVAIHTLLLGRDRWGTRILRGVATETGGSFVQVTDPTKLPQTFLDLRTTGVDKVTLRVNDGPSVPAMLAGGSFSADLQLSEPENVIVATATSLDGRTTTDSVTVRLREPGCAELQVEAASEEGRPALSLSDRAVEIVVDVSRSMWGQIDGEPKIGIAKETLVEALDWLPSDLQLSLRAYGHQYPSDQKNCKDTELLVPRSAGNRRAIRDAISGLRPTGQTPLGYALEQISADFGDFGGERAVVLVTDGIESCGGDAPAAARALSARGVPVHVIGFGLGNAEDEDLDSLRAIAEASGGRFVTAGSAAELREALSTTVGTPYRLLHEDVPVARGTLGANDVIRVLAGDYTVRLESTPPVEIPVTLEAEERQTLQFQRQIGDVSHRVWRDVADYQACDESSLAALVEEPAPEPTPPAAPIAKIADRPAAPAPAAAPTPAPTPRSETKARRNSSMEIPGGRVEIWQNLRADRKAEWGVVVRHPTVDDGSSMVWQGNDLEEAEQVANGVRDTMMRLGGGAETP